MRGPGMTQPRLPAFCRRGNAIGGAFGSGTGGTRHAAMQLVKGRRGAYFIGCETLWRSDARSSCRPVCPVAPAHDCSGGGWLAGGWYAGVMAPLRHGGLLRDDPGRLGVVPLEHDPEKWKRSSETIMLRQESA